LNVGDFSFRKELLDDIDVAGPEESDFDARLVGIASSR
jgi:hypothetical protein